MARPPKVGIDYFPLDVCYFEDSKLKFVISRFGFKGEIVTIRLLAQIYRENGYYINWDEDSALLFASSVGNDSYRLVNDVVAELVKRQFFDKEIFDSFHVLTSHGIQVRFLNAVERRKDVKMIQEFLLADIPLKIKNVSVVSLGMKKQGYCNHNVDNNRINADINRVNTGERKGKERKGNNATTTTVPSDDLAEVAKSYQENIRPVISPIESDKLKDLIATYGKDTCLKAIERAVVRGGRSMGYLSGILRSWEQNGYDEEGETNGRTGTDRPKGRAAVSGKTGRHTDEGDYRNWENEPTGWDD